MKWNLSLVVCLLSLISSAFSKENVNQATKHSVARVQANCSPSTAMTDLDIGNVRARILMNGDMWWDMVGSSKYEVPKGSGKYSLFAGALWMGGKDMGGNLPMAAQTYRQSGSDFWPGPLDTIIGTTTAATCNQYNQHWKVTRTEVSNFISNGTVTPVIQNWPGNGNAANNEAHFLAPFVDVNADGIYNPANGDYPAFDFSAGGCAHCNSSLHGDQAIWWVFNDAGNIHTETGGASLGIEIQAQAFAFNSGITNLDNATFYEYKIINRSSLTKTEFFFGQWVDPDLGNYLDDYVGCDVERGMGYCYNGDAFDDTLSGGYGYNPPAIGVDFLEGPNADVGDGKDNDRDSCVDCTWVTDSLGNVIAVSDAVLPEHIKMSKFVYYNLNGSTTGNPVTVLDYYNYMKGIWKDGTKITYGGDGHGGGIGATSDTCDFMLPGVSDPKNWGTRGTPEAPWDEAIAGNAPGDRRFLQSTGPFTLLPGSVKCVTTAVVWARATSGGPSASVALLQQADDEIQQYFNSCFTTYPISTNDLSVSNAMKIFPNPFHDFTTIQLPALLNKQFPLEVVLYDVFGKPVRSYHKIESNSATINRDGLKSGIYLFRVFGRGGMIKTGKLVIID
ncbi:MAG: T9SS type A sorting domain-containing protein [Bacteroidetes bacterium]|nr:T9SS type A sorting domain-containing protein [Bacteroidota bacterium]